MPPYSSIVTPTKLGWFSPFFFFLLPEQRGKGSISGAVKAETGRSCLHRDRQLKTGAAAGLVTLKLGVCAAPEPAPAQPFLSVALVWTLQYLSER